MKYYTFDQNNSGGVFEGPHYVIIQAPSAQVANVLAEDHGVYFDGCESGQDCDCCGDRWYRTNESNGYEAPSLYGPPIDLITTTLSLLLVADGKATRFGVDE